MIFFKILFYCQLQAVTLADEEHNSIKIKSFMLSETDRRKFSLFIFTQYSKCPLLSTSQHPQRSIRIYRKKEK